MFSSKASFEFKPLFDTMLLNLRERNAASGGEEMLRLRAYEKLQGLVHQGGVNRTYPASVPWRGSTALSLKAVKAFTRIWSE